MGDERARWATMGNHVRLSWGHVLVESIRRLSPGYLISANPIMFTVELGALLLVALLAVPGAVPPRMEFFYASIAAILVVTVWFSTFSESFSELQAKARVDSLRALEKEIIAHRVTDVGTEDVRSSVLRPGDRVKLSPGDFVPRDGFVVEGAAFVDESMLTGESEPAFKSKDDHVLGGTKVISGSLIVEISAEAGKGFVDRMMDMVSSARRPRTQSEISLSILLGVLSMIFIIIVGSLYFTLYFMGYRPDVAMSVSLLVALMPTTIGGLLPAIGIAGVSRLAKDGIVAKSGRAIEASGDTDVVILDKTGTVTEGNRSAVEFVPFNGYTEADVGVASFMASMNDSTKEGRSIVELAESKGYVPPSPLMDEVLVSRRIEFSAETRYSGIEFIWSRKPYGPRDFQRFSGPGERVVNRLLEMRVRGEGARVIKGSVDVILGMARPGNPGDVERAVREVSSRGETPLLVAVNDEVIGMVVLKDRVKPGIRERLRELSDMGLKIVMITGDNPLTARAIAEDAGIRSVIARARPEDKLKAVEEEQSLGHIVGVVGDGTNDAPALAKADVGLAMNSGTAAAKDAANMIDLESDPSRIIKVIQLGKQLLTTRGSITTFSIANDVAKYFTILPMMLLAVDPRAAALNVLHLYNPETAVLATMIFNAIIIPALIPLALRGAGFSAASPRRMLVRNVLIYGLGGAALPFVAIKAIDYLLYLLLFVR
ncbi:HAD-IC family P-type ATPase [Conexivisphaera calida]|uniref:Potassium-transporting ATPase ATP-binding subunit n=1 Tax=Conexivisphaera calida TaxID=1874277 RepID=A0A4P2VH88_9ARCH|nr:HAD-IC family P-type ATPase [Conexivisphaera calida]BBE42592.1 Potassium-transporting ATPase B chain [Conexivisphaera calida]